MRLRILDQEVNRELQSRFTDLLPQYMYDGVITQNGGLSIVANLQTLSISSVRSTSPVRVLGQAQPKAFTSGARTVAGSMIFAMIARDAFLEIFRRSKFENMRETFYTDMLPPFSIFITGQNEYGQIGRQVIDGVRLTNFGTTYSIDDLYTEQTYTYVAEYVSPFIPLDEQGLVETALDPSRKVPNGFQDPVPLQAPTTISGAIVRGRWPHQDGTGRRDR